MSVFKRLHKIALPHYGTLVVGLFLLLVSTVLDTAAVPALLTVLLFLIIGAAAFTMTGFNLPWDLDQRVNDFIGPGDHVNLLLQLSALIGFVILVKCALQARQGYLLNKFGYLVSRDLRDRLFGHLLSLSPAQFENESTGGLLSRVTGDVAVLQNTLGPQLADTVQAPPAITIALALMLLLNWKLTLAVLCLGPLVSLLVVFVGRQLRKLIAIAQDRLAGLNSYLAELLGNVHIIQSFTHEQYEAEKARALNRVYYADSMRSVFTMEMLGPTAEFMGMVGMLLGIGIGGVSVLHGNMDPKAFILFFAVAQRASNQFKRVAQIGRVVQQINGASERVFALLNVPPAIRDAADARPLPSVEGRVSFENVSFSYSEGNNVLSEITFEAEPGEILALVGPSGSGKSTLTKLLLRFYDPGEGRILIDGHDLRDVTLLSLRGQMGIVPQETLLFSGTIRDNIRYGRLEASDEEIAEAAVAANALEFIERMPDGFQTVVGERGSRLSGGQRQRIAIARVLLKNPRILILDEATSALDTESERLVQQALEHLMKGRTTFVIAHRLSTVRHANRILALDQGRIAQIGSHRQLMAKGGLYRRLYEMQFSEPAAQTDEVQPGADELPVPNN